MTAVVLLDGGMGQELLRRSAQPPHPLWSAKVLMDEPGIVQAVHEDYIRAGARVITLNTYSATPERLERHGAPEMFLPLQTRAAELARAAVGAGGTADGAAVGAGAGAASPRVRIGGCLPPLHASYRPDLATDYDELLGLYRRIVEAQADHVDLFQCETLASRLEARAAVTAARESGLPVWLSLSIRDDMSATLRSGEPLGEVLDEMVALGPEAILLNCSIPEAITAALPALVATSKPAGAYANGFTGIAALKPGGTVDVLDARKDLTPEVYAARALGWVDAGAVIAGGCCEVGPQHIATLARALEDAGHQITGDLS